jgi:hypothetical protein
MAICFECGVKHGNTIKQNGLFGWIDQCFKCKQVTKVYPNKDFGVNPPLRNPVTKQHI